MTNILGRTSNAWTPVATFSCRGVEPIAFDPMERLALCKSTLSDTTFEFQLGDEWCDYDDEANEPVSALDFESKIE